MDKTKSTSSLVLSYCPTAEPRPFPLKRPFLGSKRWWWCLQASAFIGSGLMVNKKLFCVMVRQSLTPHLTLAHHFVTFPVHLTHGLYLVQTKFLKAKAVLNKWTAVSKTHPCIPLRCEQLFNSGWPLGSSHHFGTGWQCCSGHGSFSYPVAYSLLLVEGR